MRNNVSFIFIVLIKWCKVTIPSELPWFLLQLKPNAYSVAVTNLRRQGIDVFLPRLERPQKKGKAAANPYTPLFPGYAFARLDIFSKMLRTVNSTLGVSRVVRFGGSFPRPIPDNLITGLQQRCDADGILRRADRLRPDDKVGVISGPFADFVGIVETIRPDERVTVLLNMMGRSVNVVLHEEHLSQIQK